MAENHDQPSRALCIEAAKKQPNPDQIKAYIAQGADINYQSQEDGLTPLMHAVRQDNEPLVAYLLKEGANPLIQNKTREIASDMALAESPIYQLLKNYELIMAATHNDALGIEIALNAGADINFKGKGGYSALLIAAEQGFLESVEVLVVHGADASVARDDGMGIFFLAKGDLVYETIDFGEPFTEEEKQKFLNPEPRDWGCWDRWRSKTLEARNGQPFALSQLKFRSCYPAATKAQIDELEAYFGHPLPEVLKEIFATYNGGKPALNYFGEDGRWNIDYFYSLGNDESDITNIWRVIKDVSQYLGVGALPFAEDSSYDIYFLKWVDGAAQVWIYSFNDDSDYDEDDYEEGQIPSIKVRLFDSLDEMLEELYAAKD